MSARDDLRRFAQDFNFHPSTMEHFEDLISAYRAETIREAAVAVADFTGNYLDANAKMLRRMAEESEDL